MMMLHSIIAEKPRDITMEVRIKPWVNAVEGGFEYRRRRFMQYEAKQ